jgi:hypothetical protein
VAADSVDGGHASNWVAHASQFVPLPDAEDSDGGGAARQQQDVLQADGVTDPAYAHPNRALFEDLPQASEPLTTPHHTTSLQ